MIESRSKKILRYEVPADDRPLGTATKFYDLGGSGGDGCAFDSAGNLWVADFHRPKTDQGRITVLSPQAKVLAQLDVPAKVVSNIAFGGENHDEIYCTTGTPDGVFRAAVGVNGFAGHPGKATKIIRELTISPDEPASGVHPRRFGVSGGAERTRGWYVWRKWDPETRRAEVSHERTGQRYHVRVLPWATTYRHLVYGGGFDELLPGERFNPSFAADENHRRGYLVSFQDELCQMKGHGHAWLVRSVDPKGNRFIAQVMAGDKPLEEEAHAFAFDPKCGQWRDGKKVEPLRVNPGERIYMTWVYREKRRVAMLVADDASLPVIKAAEEQRVAQRLAAEGMAGHVEAVDKARMELLIFSTYWAQANPLKPGVKLALHSAGRGLRPEGAAVDVRLVAHKNLGTYSSGCTEMTVELIDPADAERAAKWVGGTIVRIIPR